MTRHAQQRSRRHADLLRSHRARRAAAQGTPPRAAPDPRPAALEPEGQGTDLGGAIDYLMHDAAASRDRVPALRLRRPDAERPLKLLSQRHDLVAVTRRGSGRARAPRPRRRALRRLRRRARRRGRHERPRVRAGYDDALRAERAARSSCCAASRSTKSRCAPTAATSSRCSSSSGGAARGGAGEAALRARVVLAVAGGARRASCRAGDRRARRRCSLARACSRRRSPWASTSSCACGCARRRVRDDRISRGSRTAARRSRPLIRARGMTARTRR